MSEAFIERLNRFTPDAGGLDRDTLLFEAGRASARPNRAWMGLSAVLASTQMLALVFLWPQSNRTLQTIRHVAAPSVLPHATETVFESPPLNSDIWSVRHQADDVELDRQLASVGAPAASEPILRAFGPLPSSVVN